MEILTPIIREKLPYSLFSQMAAAFDDALLSNTYLYTCHVIFDTGITPASPTNVDSVGDYDRFALPSRTSIRLMPSVLFNKESDLSAFHVGFRFHIHQGDLTAYGAKVTRERLEHSMRA